MVELLKLINLGYTLKVHHKGLSLEPGSGRWHWIAPYNILKDSEKLHRTGPAQLWLHRHVVNALLLGRWLDIYGFYFAIRSLFLSGSFYNPSSIWLHVHGVHMWSCAYVYARRPCVNIRCLDVLDLSPLIFDADSVAEPVTHQSENCCLHSSLLQALEL